MFLKVEAIFKVLLILFVDTVVLSIIFKEGKTPFGMRGQMPKIVSQEKQPEMFYAMVATICLASFVYIVFTLHEAKIF